MTNAQTVFLWYRTTHERILSLITRASEEQMQWRPAPQAHNIAFTFWHVVRWTDHLQMCISSMSDELHRQFGPGRQIWEEERLGERWGFYSPLGEADTGMTLADEAASALAMPEKAVLVDYAQRVFALAQRKVAAIDDEMFHQINRDNANETILDAIMIHIIHNNRHLGEMEYPWAPRRKRNGNNIMLTLL